MGRPVSFLLVLHHAATAITCAGALYAACIAFAVATSLAAPSASLRSEARETLKILLLRKQ
jgi:hypothetical protein